MERHKKDKRQRKKVPRVPIKTYKWEDIRRARLRGGYPWTYLYKEPFNENIDPRIFTMEAMSKSKSSSPLPKSTETLDIKEITEDTNNLIPEPSGYIVITEVPSDSESHSKNVNEGSVTIEDVGEPETTNLESAESSDNISQYLDKEEVVEPVPTSTKIEENGRQERAKSEEPKRKRKLSIDSSYSRKSLSKLAIMKKLKEAKDKIKVPKLNLPKSLKHPPEKSTNKPEAKPKEALKPDPNLKPVYIHIPLKPPEGETDEFSYLEFGEKKPEPEPKIEEKPPEEEIPKIEIEASFNEERRFSGDPDDIVAFEILKTETIDLDHASKNGLSGGSDYLIIQQDDDAKSENMIIIMPGTEDETKSLKTPSRQGSRKIRAKSAEPERKRRPSVDSSSSLSKLSLMQKLKEFKLPKLSLSRSGSKKEQEKKPEVKETKPEVKKIEPKGTEPKYIHIPLKPPPGQTDEFSYLENEEKKETQKEDPSKVEESSVEISPTSPKNEGVQFIFLTPPSDDEVLKEPEVPETPSSETSDESKLTELKKLAKDAVEKVSPESQKKILQPVEEETDAKSLEEEKMVVDEEDGLKLTESAMALQEQNIKAKEVAELKSSLKTPESPVLKKKVSFKRRSRDDSKDTDYEEVQAPEEKDQDDKKKLDVLGNSQSMSVDEEKSYLDEQKIIKSTSLEEDYNRWSKLSDHEYEPVNPPPDIPSAAPPTVHVIDSEQNLQPKPISLASSTTSLDRRMLGSEPLQTAPDYTVEEIQTEIETKYFTKTPPKQETTTTVHTVTVTQKPKSEGPSKLQQALKTQTDKFKTKLHEIKLPPKPHLKKPNFKFEKPKFNLPKIPDSAKVNLPSFSLPRRKRSLKQRQYSTESNAGDSKTNYFDFRTYPRLFKKKPKDDNFDSFAKNEREVCEFATVPRTKRKQESDDRWGGRDSIRIPLHSEDSMEEEREDTASHIRYDQDIDIDDAYEKENQEIHSASPFSHNYNSRWDHGSFHPEPNQQVTDLDSPIDKPQPHESFDTNTSKDIHSSESSLGIHRRGVLEEIDSDEFFLRQKGISQDNIEVGMYLSSEIREAFKSPNNALNDLQTEPYSYETRASNTSLPETTKRKVVKKPKRKKTPHVSQEQLSFDQDSELELEAPPSRPKRRSKRNKKKEEIVPYQETIAVEDENRVMMYENEQMEGKEQPEIKISDPYTGYESEDEEFKEEEKQPMAPPRKHRSLKSLNYSEHESILGDFDQDQDQDTEVYKTEHEYIIPVPEEPPIRPSRTLSRSSSKSIQDEPPSRPARSRSRTRSRAESLTEEQPCVEETCVQDFRDHMGYAIVDKNIRREPPLPPPKTPPRRKRSIQSEQKFFTVPRPVSEEPPVRPLRNYSTLGPSRPPRRKHPVPNMTDEEKENIDITQYIEIDEEPNRDLQSGVVIQKMKDRPLPAPPRPPRNKTNKPLHDITSQENIAVEESEEQKEVVEETEASTQTTEIRLITPTNYTYEEETITHGSLVVEPLNGAKILPDHEFTRIDKPKERTIPVEEEDEETSEIPEEFSKLKDPPPTVTERTVIVQPDSNTEVEVLKAQKLQVSDLDIDRLNVNELLASRIVVSEIDSGSIQTNDLSSKSGALKVGEIELPPGLIQQLLDKLQPPAPPHEESASPSEPPEQKKTPIEQSAPQSPR
ncbi:titin isoform X2 [Tribolium castaneum]|uniref:titin isoform X2 n=1 Tax=Tribolium castaneum TaxID=7070 RepID=UPI00046BEF8D|nr:PREDICTED: titin isoform X2 [Tribolium castaneum]|eukprot:XP_008190548.1 PREDICTED: titin isoform X2 [Tribolium castaneum]